MRLIIGTLLVFAASSASAQATKTPPPAKQAAKTAAPNAAVKQDAKAPPPGTKQAPSGTKGAAAPTRGLSVAAETTATVKLPEILRESYVYDAGGRRDPFFSLISSEDLRPSVADLRLTGVLYHPTRPIAVMRDVTTNTRYTATLGTQLGRMRVIQIRPRIVIFTIEEFGLNRRDSLVLGDTTRARER